MKEMDGQVNLFDILNQQEETPDEPQVILNVGQELYVVAKGDVKKAEVFDERSWLCEGNDRGYRLKFENGTYGCTWNSCVDKNVFFTKETAMIKAEKYLNTHEVIRSEDIHPVRTTAYQYTRKTDKRIMTAFYSELENGMIYIKKFMTYHYMMEADKKKNAIENFMKQQEFKYDDVKQVKYEPVFKNMYKIRQKYDWDYAEADHSLAIG